MFEKQRRELLLKNVEEQKETGSSYSERLVNNIIQNIKIEVTNIYFRFEDKMSGDKNFFSLGLQLKEFSVFNCDSNFEKLEPGQTERPDLIEKEKEGKDYYKDLLFKKIKIKGFSIFCDWENVSDPKNGGIDIEKLNHEQKNVYSKLQKVSDKVEEIDHHKHIAGDPHDHDH